MLNFRIFILCKANRTMAYLLVNRAPAIIRQPSLLRAAGPLGGRVQLRCRAHAVPDAHFQWIVQGQSSPVRRNSSKYSFTTLQLNHSTFEVSISSITYKNLLIFE